MLIAKEKCQKAIKIARMNDMECIFYDCLNYNEFIVPKSLPKKLFLYYEFEQPFDASAFNCLKIIELLKRFCEVVLIAPFFPFLREHDEEFKSFSLNLFDLQIITLDAHVMHKNIISLQLDYNIDPSHLIVFPDAGAKKRYGNLFDDYIVGKKDRSCDTVFEEINKAKGKDCMIIDDIIDSGFTLQNAAKQLRKAGAAKVGAIVTHYLSSYNAHEGLDYFLTSDTLVSDINAKICDFSHAFKDLRRKSELKQL